MPRNAVLLLGLSSIGFTLSGTFDFLTDVIVFGLLLFNGLAVASVYVLRRTLPEAERPYRVWGYPAVPALYLTATLYLMINTFIATPGRALVGLGIIALGIPFMPSTSGGFLPCALRIGSEGEPGEMDPDGKVLTLDTEGPSFTAEGKTVKYKDSIELKSDDHRVLTSRFQDDDGNWHEFMTSHYRRTK